MLEICCADFESVLVAAQFGADRIELCSGLKEGGLTPSWALIKKAVSVPGINVHVLIRPRPGDFVYSEEEIEIMEADIRTARRLGADGVVFGVLNTDGTINTVATARLLKAAGSMYATFHRAFDLCCNPLDALATLIDMEFDGLLTSGQAPTALQGADMLRQLEDKAHGNIDIIAASGVNSGNVEEIHSISGVTDFHASAGYNRPSSMAYRNPGVSMGGGADEYVYRTTSPAEVEQLAQTIKSFES